jgi:hypothetical protein
MSRKWVLNLIAALCCGQALADHKVLLEGTLLKPNMVSAGAAHPALTPLSPSK